MSEPNVILTNITPPRVPLTDSRTGLISREWYRFFFNLFQLTGSGTNYASLTDLQVGPPVQEIDLTTVDPVPAGFAAYAAGSTQESQIAEIEKQLQGLASTNDVNVMQSELAEVWKQLQALQLVPEVSPGALTDGSSILYGNGSGGFSNVTIGTGVSFTSGTLSATGTGGTVTAVTGTAPVVSSGGTTPAISMAAATTSVNGYLTSTDWNTFNSKQPSGTYVTSISVASSNGLAGTSSGGATPALTLSTSVTGILKGNGTAISAAVANTDYVPLSTVLTKTADYTITNTDTWIINNKSGSALTLTFPVASAWPGRYITVKNLQTQSVNSASSNVVPIDSTSAGTAILLPVIGNWATMVSDGTNWVIMQQAPNNILLLE
jgi:hypothetical protein